MKKFIFFCLLVASMGARAVPMMASGDFNGVNLGTASAVDGISGSWSFIFDDSAITGIGNESILGISLTAFSLSPNPLGSTTFDLTNTVADIEFTNNVVTFIAIGGALAGAQGIGFNTDDFLAFYGSSTNLSSLSWTLASEPNLATQANEFGGSFQVTRAAPIPLPGTLALLAIGLAGIRIARRK